jgi:hypothetical protein
VLRRTAVPNYLGLNYTRSQLSVVFMWLRPCLINATVSRDSILFYHVNTRLKRHCRLEIPMALSASYRAKLRLDQSLPINCQRESIAISTSGCPWVSMFCKDTEYQQHSELSLVSKTGQFICIPKRIVFYNG